MPDTDHDTCNSISVPALDKAPYGRHIVTDGGCTDMSNVLPDRGFAPQRRTEALVEALPYIQQFRGKVIVVKFGGNAMVDDALAQTFAEDIVLLRSVGLKPVVVHGGGPQIGELLARLGMETEFVDGLRVTDAATLDVARMVLVGKVGRDIVGAINVHGAYAVGLSGEDGGMITATPRSPELGFVGDIVSVNTGIIDGLLAEGMIPVVSTIGSDASGQAYNINADTVAGALAGALSAEKVIYLSDVPGLLTNVDDPSSLVARVSISDAHAMIEDGTISGGMIPKITACVDAVEAGATSAHMLDGRVPHVLLLELFTNAGIGTMLTAPTPLSARSTDQGLT
jgi:acetylglutamate kinase